jgi:uncharacterized protein
MDQASAAGPARDRIELLDALRGFALLGILLANILVFSGWMFLGDEEKVALAGEAATQWQQRFHRFFVDGKFYTIFSLLFGAGFALQLQSLKRRGADGLRIYRRRVLILLAIGLVHSMLIWDGDILTLYALLGLLLPLFHRLPDRVLLAWAGTLIFIVPPLGMLLFRLLGWPADAGLMSLSDSVAMALGVTDPKDGVGWVRREDFWGWFSWIASGPIFSLGIRVESWRIPKVLGIMLIGICLGRRLASGNLLGDTRLLWRVLLAGAAIGIPANIAYALRGQTSQADWPSLIGTAPMGLAYAAAFALAWPRAQRVLGVFAAPGRMALTNYLAQSVVCVFVFYGIGLGQVGYWPPALFYGFAVALFAAQLTLSHLWLAHHRQGPLEALWRRWTYRGGQPVAGTAAAL